MLSQELMDLASESSLENLQAELAVKDAALIERQAALQAAHEAEIETRGRVPVLQELRAGRVQKLRELDEQLSIEVVSLGADCDLEGHGASRAKKADAIDILDRAIDVLIVYRVPESHIAVLTVQIGADEAAAQVADQERLVNYRQMVTALASLEGHGEISVVTELSENLDKRAALLWEKHSRTIAELAAYTEQHQRNLQRRASAGNLTRANLPFAA